MKTTPIWIAVVGGLLSAGLFVKSKVIGCGLAVLTAAVAYHFWKQG